QRDEPPGGRFRVDLDLCPGRDGVRHGARAGSGMSDAPVSPAAFSVRMDAAIAVVTIDVPGERVNTLGPATMTAWDELLGRLGQDSSVRGVVLISGKPDAFVAGADINEFQRLTTTEAAEALSRAVHAALDRVEQLQKPVVVAIHGACLGLGLELSL